MFCFCYSFFFVCGNSILMLLRPAFVANIWPVSLYWPLLISYPHLLIYCVPSLLEIENMRWGCLLGFDWTFWSCFLVGSSNIHLVGWLGGLATWKGHIDESSCEKIWMRRSTVQAITPPPHSTRGRTKPERACWDTSQSITVAAERSFELAWYAKRFLEKSCVQSPASVLAFLWNFTLFEASQIKWFFREAEVKDSEVVDL